MKLIFDLDGTLVDSLPDIHASAAVALEGFGKPPLEPEVIRSFIGNGVAVLIDKVAAATGLQGHEPALLRAFLDFYEPAPYRLTRPFPGGEAALKALAQMGYKMAVCTNKPEAPAQDILQGLGLAQYFDAVVGGDTLPFRKPDPRALTGTQDRLGGGPVLYIGDSEVDAETAEAAAIPLLLFTKGYRQRPVEHLTHLAAYDHFDALPGLVAHHAKALV